MNFVKSYRHHNKPMLESTTKASRLSVDQINHFNLIHSHFPREVYTLCEKSLQYSLPDQYLLPNPNFPHDACKVYRLRPINTLLVFMCDLRFHTKQSTCSILRLFRGSTSHHCDRSDATYRRQQCLRATTEYINLSKI